MSALTLYEIAADFKSAAETLSNLDLDAQTIADTLEGLSGALEVKATNVAKFYLSLDATAAACKQRAKEMADRAKAIESRANAMREYLSRNLEAAGIDKIEGPELKITWRPSSAVVIDAQDLVPDEYMRTPEPPPPAPDKAAIAAALKQGKAVPGAHLEQCRNLQIK